MDVVQTNGPMATKGLFDVSGIDETLGSICPRELSAVLVGPGFVRVGAFVVCCLGFRFGRVEEV